MLYHFLQEKKPGSWFNVYRFVSCKLESSVRDPPLTGDVSTKLGISCLGDLISCRPTCPGGLSLSEPTLLNDSQTPGGTTGGFLPHASF